MNDTGYVAGFKKRMAGNWGSPEKIIAVSEGFETKIFSTEIRNTMASTARRRRQRGGPNKR